MPEIVVRASLCRAAITAEKEQVCRNLDTRSALLVKCSKALIISNIVLLMIISGRLFRQVGLLLSSSAERNGVFYCQSEKCYISAIIYTEGGSVAASMSE